MKLTKQYILDRVNKMLISFKVTWEDMIHELDMGIEEINKYISTTYPLISEILDDDSEEEKTYTYREGGIDKSFFPNKYFFSIVIPYAVSELLAYDEEFSEVYIKYMNQWQENLFVMARDEMSSIPYKFIGKPQGVYFPNPEPNFKYNPEEYFNRKIKIEEPKLKVVYNWGDYEKELPNYVSSFVSLPLPIDNNFYEKNSKVPIAQLNDVYIVDYDKQVLGIFLGWSLTKGGIIIDKPYVNITDEDITLYARFDLDVIGIVYRGNGGTLHNWKPIYITASTHGDQIIYPYGGTAEKTGYLFKGFKPNQIPANLLLQDSSQIGIGGLNEIDLIAANDTSSEKKFAFKAMWEKRSYTITYKNNLNNEVKTQTYYYGQEFDLELPNEPAWDYPGLFIGWWDNNKFEGDPITKIYSSDYGDKIFYANFNAKEFKIRFFNHVGFLIYEENFLSNSQIGTVIEIPQPELTLVKDDYNGLYYNWVFENWKYQNIIVTEDTIVKENMDIHPYYARDTEVLVDLQIEIYKGSSLEEVKTVNIQMGKTIDFYSLILDGELPDKFEGPSGELNFILSHFEINGEPLASLKILDDSIVVQAIYEQKEGFLFDLVEPLLQFVHIPSDVAQALYWVQDGNLNGVANALDWNEESPGTNEYMGSLLWVPTENDYQIIEGPLSEIELLSNLDGIITEKVFLTYFKLYMNLNGVTNPLKLIEEPPHFYFQNKLKIGSVPLTEDGYDVSNYDGVSQVKAIYDTVPTDDFVDDNEIEFLIKFNQAHYLNPVLMDTKKITDYNSSNRITVNLNELVNYLYVLKQSNELHKGFKVNGVVLTNLNLSYSKTDIDNFSTDENGFKYILVEPNIVPKAGFTISVSVNIDPYIPEAISMFPNDADLNFLTNSIFPLYKNYFQNEINQILIDKGIKNLLWDQENENKVILNSNELISKINNERFSKGLELVKYTYNGVDSYDFPIAIRIPKAEAETKNLSLTINLKLGLDTGDNRIYIANRFSYQEGFSLDTDLFSNYDFDLKELYIIVPQGDKILDKININLPIEYEDYDVELYNRDNNNIEDINDGRSANSQPLKIKLFKGN